jgi:tRNA threonylcarbamoyladenosine modification (KEOPS) complex  Pcc1 subunit
MIEGKIRIRSPNSDIISGSLTPDNPKNMKTEMKNDEIVIYISMQKLSSLIATMDDYLMNLKIAEDIMGEV